MIIEYVHRLSSAVAFILVVVLLFWAFRIFPRASLARRLAGLTMFFMVTEALLGAGLVLFGLVAENDSFARAWVMAFHLLNTFLLLGCLSLTAWLASGKGHPRWKGRSQVRWVFFTGLLGLVVVGASGAVAALGDTLFPSKALSLALREDFSPSAHLLIRLRVYHPILALLVGLLLLSAALAAVRTKANRETKRLAFLTGCLYLIQLSVGFFNLLLLAPVWLQLVHLLVSDLIWIAMLLLSAAALAAPTADSKFTHVQSAASGV